ncbi:hypothetical protein [Longimicrobium sp.]|uniref:hypothetical protein n=1 Tax=Longimicrobium sp. TaxID=2029185 RepID=UPI003B3B7523
MRHTRGMLKTYLKRQGHGRYDLDALSVLSLTAMAHRALGGGPSGVRFARWAVGAILAVRLLASLEQGGWFRRKADRPPRRQRNDHGCR